MQQWQKPSVENVSLQSLYHLQRSNEGCLVIPSLEESCSLDLGRLHAPICRHLHLRADSSSLEGLLSYVIMNFKFSNLLGAPYRGGNLLIQGQELYSAVGNRVSVVKACCAPYYYSFANDIISDAMLSCRRTWQSPLAPLSLLSAASRYVITMDTALIDTALRNDELNEHCCGQVRVICTSPDNLLLLAIDADGRCLVINKKRRALLHRFSFKGPVGAACFSPDGRFIACAVGKMLQVHRSPGSCEAAFPGFRATGCRLY